MRHLLLILSITFLAVFTSFSQHPINCDVWKVVIFSDSSLLVGFVDSTDYDSVKLVFNGGEIVPSNVEYDYVEDEVGNREMYFTFFYFDTNLYALEHPKLVVF